MSTSLHVLDDFFVEHVAPALLTSSHNETITATAVDQTPKVVPQDLITVRTVDRAPQVLLTVSVPVPDESKCTSTIHLPSSNVKKRRDLRQKGQSQSSNAYTIVELVFGGGGHHTARPRECSL